MSTPPTLELYFLRTLALIAGEGSSRVLQSGLVEHSRPFLCRCSVCLLQMLKAR
jgi:hypothetical protein